MACAVPCRLFTQFALATVDWFLVFDSTNLPSLCQGISHPFANTKDVHFLTDTVGAFQLESASTCSVAAASGDHTVLPRSDIDATPIDAVCDDLESLDSRLPLSGASRSTMAEASAALAKKQIRPRPEQLEVCLWACVFVRASVCVRECVRASVSMLSLKSFNCGWLRLVETDVQPQRTAALQATVG